MISTAKNKSGDLFQQAMESFETALRAGMKLQEESTQRCVEILRDVGSPLEWERTVPAKVTKAIAAMQQNVDQSIRFMNENAQQTVNLMETALQMHQANSDGERRRRLLLDLRLERHADQRRDHPPGQCPRPGIVGELAKEVLQRVEIMREEVTRVTEMGMQPKL